MLVLILSIAVLSGYFISKIRLVEDLAKVVPIDEKTKKMNFIFSNARFMDKLFVNVYLNDSNLYEPDTLIAIADRFEDSLKAMMPVYVSSYRKKVDENQIFKVFDIFYRNLPDFLDTSDYQRIDSLLQDDEIRNALKKSYKNLISPTGFAMKKFIARDPIGFSSVAMKKLNELQIDESFEVYNSHIFANGKKNLLMFITPANPSKETAVNGEFIAHLDSVIDGLKIAGGGKYSIEYFGSTAIGVCNANRLKKDIVTTVSIAFLILILAISLFFRRWTVFFVLFIPAVFGGSIALALLYLLKAELSAIALGIGAVLLGITVDYSLHLYTHFRNLGSIKIVLKDLVEPILMSSFTTAAAFVCLVFLHSEALSDLGIFAAVSVACAALFALIVLPHFIRKRKPGSSSQTTEQNTLIDRIVNYSYDKVKFLRPMILLLSVLFFITAHNITFESDMTKLGYMSKELLQAEDHLDQIADYRLRSMFLIAEGKTLDDALFNLEGVKDIVDSLRKADVVRKASGVGSLLHSEYGKNKKMQNWKQFWTEDKKAEFRERIAKHAPEFRFRESAFEEILQLIDKPDSVRIDSSDQMLIDLFLGEYISVSEGNTILITMLKVPRELKPKVYEAFNNETGAYVIDNEYITNRFIDLLKDDFNTLVYISLIIVALFLIIIFGRVEMGLITLVPMILSWIWTLGIMGLIGMKFTIFSVIISTFIFGLGIDYSIFITRGLMQKYKTGVDNLRSYKTSIFLSAMTTIIGIGSLSFALHPALRSIALLSVIGIVSVVLIAFTIQPVLFRWLVERKGEKRIVPITLFTFVYALVCYSFFMLWGVLILLLRLTVLWLVPSKKYRDNILHWLIYLAAKSTMAIMFLLKKDMENTGRHNFKKPALVICNHQSLIDIPISLMFTPKMIVLTTDWVQKSVSSGLITKFADFYPVSLGPEVLVEKLRKKVEEGYSVFVFPEGTRSKDCRIKRYHKGSFYLAEKLGLDIVPIVMHGSGHYVSKSQLHGRKSKLTLKVLPRIKHDDTSYGETYQEKTKSISRMVKKEFLKIEEGYKNAEYFKDLLIKNYLYKGIKLEYQARRETRRFNSFHLMNSVVSEDASVLVVNSGNGYLSNLLAFASKERKVTGFDSDEERVLIAKHSAPAGSDTEYFLVNNQEYPSVEADTVICLKQDGFFDYEKLSERFLKDIPPGGQLIFDNSGNDNIPGFVKSGVNYTFEAVTDQNNPKVRLLIIKKHG